MSCVDIWVARLGQSESDTHNQRHGHQPIKAQCKHHIIHFFFWTHGDMGRSSKYVVTPGAGEEDQVPLPWLVSTLLLLTSFTLYLLDQATDALTALLYFLDVSLKCSYLCLC